jgi:hypothetical protein
MWNKGGENLPHNDLGGGLNGERQAASRGQRVRPNGDSGRPLTRSNQRRPVSRQVNAIDNSGVSVQKMLVQQQMRNTHFGGEGGGGFH